MAGENCVLTVPNYGTYQLVVISASYDLNIIATEEQSVNAKYLYTRQVQTDTFSIQAVFTQSGDRRAFANWYQGYAKQATSPSPVGPMRVQIPSRNFDMFGFLTDGVQETFTPKDVTWTLSLNFKGAFMANQSGYASGADPISLASGPDAANPYFYPSGNPSSGPTYNPAPITNPTSSQVQYVINQAQANGWL